MAELRLDTDYQGSEGIGWAPVVAAAGVPAVEAEMNAALRRMREPVRQELSRGMAAGEFRGVDIQHADEMIWQSYQHGLRAVSVNGGTPAMAVPQVFKTLEALSA